LLESGADDAEIPKWLDEGLAQVLAGQMNYMDTATLGRAVASGRLLTLWQIEGMMGLPETGARLAYAESAIAVELLRERYGYSGISNLVHELRRGRREEEIFPVLFGMPLGAFESELFSHIRNTYGLTLVTDTELWISIAFVVALFLAGIAVWRRKRRKLREWDDESGASAGDAEREPSVPYTVNYTIVRSRGDDDDENSNDDNHKTRLGE
jgi:hypothetical protein